MSLYLNNLFLIAFPPVAAATVLPKFLKFWAPPHDLALFFIIVWILEPFGHALSLDRFDDYK